MTRIIGTNFLHEFHELCARISIHIQSLASFVIIDYVIYSILILNSFGAVAPNRLVTK